MYCILYRSVSITAIASWTAVFFLLCTLTSPVAATPIEARLAEVITNNRRCQVVGCHNAEIPSADETPSESSPPVAFSPPPPEATPAVEPETPAPEESPSAAQPEIGVSEAAADVAATNGAFGRAQISPLLAFTAASVGGAILAVF